MLTSPGSPKRSPAGAGRGSTHRRGAPPGPGPSWRSETPSGTALPTALKRSFGARFLLQAYPLRAGYGYSNLHYDTFLIRWRTELAWFGAGTATFVLDATGQVAEMKLDVPNDDLWFHELEMKRR